MVKGYGERMKKTTLYCDHCDKETTFLNKISISTKSWKRNVELCGECFGVLDDAKHDRGSTFNDSHFCKMIYKKVKSILEKARKIL